MMKHYDSYKQSGIEWIGEIPSQWELKRLKHVSNSINGYSFKSEDFDLNKETPVIRIGDVGDVIDFENIIRIDSSYLETKGDYIVKKGDMLIGLTGGTIGKTGKYNYDFPSLLNQRVGLLRNNSMLLNHLLYHFLKSKIFMTNILFDCYGGGQDNISMNDINNIRIPLPPLSEQEHIVSYLDDKTTKIDELIQKKLRKIDLLKEYRTSLINTVVTKGLNPNVPMKDSGIEWIGEIPSHWEVVKVGHYTNVVRGGSPRPSGDSRYFNGDYIHWVTVQEVTSKVGKYIINTETFLTKEGMKQSRVLEPETLVLSNSGATLGIPGILKIRGCINDGVVSFVNISSEIERDFLYYFWTTQTTRLLEQQSGYGQPNLNIDIVSNIRFPLPPLSEQEQIVSYLDEKTLQIDKTIDIEKKKIQLLKEYRQSLISNVVTGKIKVVSE